MNSDFKLPNFGRVPDTYDRQYFEQLLRQMDAVLTELRSAGNLRSGSLNLSQITEYSEDLRVGSVYISDGGVLRIVWTELTEVSAPGDLVGSVGTVTVSTP